MVTSLPCALNDSPSQTKICRNWFQEIQARSVAFLMAVCIAALAPRHSLAVRKESPEVRKLIDDGLGYLEKNTDERLGAKCLIALAFHKDGASPDHPRIQEALLSCQETTAQQVREGDVYSNGLALIFLSEFNPGAHRELISRYAGSMVNRQKQNGGWGYESFKTGDISQSQYAALGYWELMQVGAAPSVNSVEKGLNWLLRTQDPSGAWGYQGKDPGDFNLVKQSKQSLSMLAAGLGSTMIFANVLGHLKPGGAAEAERPQVELPAALRKADQGNKKTIRYLSGSGVERERVMKAIARGQEWYERNYKPELLRKGQYTCYLLYSIERYKSFEELLFGNAPEAPEWFQHGYEFLKATQKEHGGWSSRSRDPCATAFAVLFLMRSTQGIINKSLGEGTLVGGRGLSANLARMKLKEGRLVTEQKPTDVDELLGMLEGSASEGLDALLKDPAALRVTNVSPQEARRLQQIVKSGNPEARVLAVTALSRLRLLDHVPTLLFAMTDPDNRVVRAARDGLRFVSRRFGGYGLSDNFSDGERYDVRDKWKNWYRRVRPDAPPVP